MTSRDPSKLSQKARLDHAGEDLAQTTSNLPTNLSGWLKKRGRSFRVKYLRYMRLHNKYLSNHRNEVSEVEKDLRSVSLLCERFFRCTDKIYLLTFVQFSVETWRLNLRECKVKIVPSKLKIVISKPGQHVRLFALNPSDYELWANALQRSTLP